MIHNAMYIKRVIETLEIRMIRKSIVTEIKSYEFNSLYS